jgi:hypothetical protein
MKKQWILEVAVTKSFIFLNGMTESDRTHH